MIRNVFILLIMASPCISSAIGFLKPTFTMYQFEDDHLGVKQSTKRTIVEFAMGWSHQNGFTAHGMYSTEKNSRLTEYASSGSTTEIAGNRTSTGLGLGWISPADPGLFVLATYHLASDFIEDSLIYKGKGYQLDGGVKFSFRRLMLGLQFSYKTYEYGSYNSGSSTIELTEPRKQTYLDPMAFMLIQF